jgi:hypothetical protein
VSATRTLQDLVRVHLAIVAMLEGSTVLSQKTREQLETFRNEIEGEIKTLKATETNAPDEVTAP